MLKFPSTQVGQKIKGAYIGMSKICRLVVKTVRVFLQPNGKPTDLTWQLGLCKALSGVQIGNSPSYNQCFPVAAFARYHRKNSFSLYIYICTYIGTMVELLVSFSQSLVVAPGLCSQEYSDSCQLLLLRARH